MRMARVLATLVFTACILVGCEANPTPRAAAPSGTQLGSSGVYVSGAVASGSSVMAR